MRAKLVSSSPDTRPIVQLRYECLSRLCCHALTTIEDACKTLEQGTRPNNPEYTRIPDCDEAQEVFRLDGCKFSLWWHYACGVVHNGTAADTVPRRWVRLRTMESRRGVHASGKHVFGPVRVCFQRVLAAGDLDCRPHGVNPHKRECGRNFLYRFHRALL